MTFIIYIIIVAAAVLLLSLLFIFLRSRKNSMLSHEYAEALLAENNGDADRAIALYQQALHHSRETKIGDRRLMVDIERRLKTLVISNDFEKSFRRKSLA